MELASSSAGKQKVKLTRVLTAGSLRVVLAATADLTAAKIRELSLSRETNSWADKRNGSLGLSILKSFTGGC